MSQLLDFYRGGKDCEGRLLADILRWDDEELEIAHDFIQWLFPLPERSRFNPDAPVLTSEDIAAFQQEESLRARLRESLDRLLSFLGFAWTADGRIANGANFARRARELWDYPNHNWLRITRILRSLTLLGLAAEAQALFQHLDELYGSRRYPITAETFAYWQNAVKAGP